VRTAGDLLHHEKPEREPMSAFNREKVLSVRHWTDTLFSFTATRNSGFRFLNGQFAMIGLEVDGRPLLRAYSMASANHEEALEFFSIKVADGPLTSRLQKIREGDTILVGRKATGTLVTDNLIPGKRLLLLSTGTGLAPFASLIKDPEIYDKFETIVLVHGCRQVSELAYGEQLVASLGDDEFFGPLMREKFVYYPTVTREPFRNRGRSCSTTSACPRWISRPIASCCAAAPACWKICARRSNSGAFLKAAMPSPAISSSRRLSSSARVATFVLRCHALSVTRSCWLTVATSKMSQAQSSNGKWLRTLRFIAKKIARRNAASAIWRATTDDDEHYVYAIAL
jgi:ferredoxin--NADP+ reductase